MPDNAVAAAAYLVIALRWAFLSWDSMMDLTKPGQKLQDCQDSISLKMLCIPIAGIVGVATPIVAIVKPSVLGTFFSQPCEEVTETS